MTTFAHHTLCLHWRRQHGQRHHWRLDSPRHAARSIHRGRTLCRHRCQALERLRHHRLACRRPSPGPVRLGGLGSQAANFQRSRRPGHAPHPRRLAPVGGRRHPNRQHWPLDRHRPRSEMHAQHTGAGRPRHHRLVCLPIGHGCGQSAGGASHWYHRAIHLGAQGVSAGRRDRLVRLRPSLCVFISSKP